MTTVVPRDEGRRRSLRSLAAEAAFRARVEEMGGTILEPVWLGVDMPHQVRCVAGHECSPRPTNVMKQGRGLCRTCAGRDSKAAEAAFRARVEELGGTVLEGRWLGKGAPHRVRCGKGHEGRSTPSSVQQGYGICQTCARRGPGSGEQAEAVFRARVEELGGVVLELAWLGYNMPHRARCAEGHECTPTPANVQRGQGICRLCSGRDPATADAAFRARVEELGGTVLEPEWLGSIKPHRVRCGAGHESFPLPHHVQRGIGICRTCAGRDPKAAEAAFRARLEELGATLLEPVYLGNHAPHRARCAEGHECRPTPGHVRQGVGICRLCAGKTWDVFYLVTDTASGHLKLGITSGDPRPRLVDHERDGFDTVLRLATSLPGDVAPELERQILSALRDAGERPVRGREYFPPRVQALVLDLVDNHPAMKPHDRAAC